MRDGTETESDRRRLARGWMRLWVHAMLLIEAWGLPTEDLERNYGWIGHALMEQAEFDDRNPKTPGSRKAVCWEAGKRGRPPKKVAERWDHFEDFLAIYDAAKDAWNEVLERLKAAPPGDQSLAARKRRLKHAIQRRVGPPSVALIVSKDRPPDRD